MKSLRIVAVGWVWVVLTSSGALAQTVSGCAAWKDDDYARDFNHSKAVSGLAHAPSWMSADIEYHDDSLDRPEINRLTGWDQNPGCRSRVVKDEMISVRSAAFELARELGRFRGCTETELESWISKLEKEKKSNWTKPVKRLDVAPEDTLRLRWAAVLSRAEKNRFLVVEEESQSDRAIYAQVLVKTTAGKTVRSTIEFPPRGRFCEQIPELENKIRKIVGRLGR